MLETTLHHPDVGRIRKAEPHDDAQCHDSPEQKFRRNHATHIASHHEEAHDRDHARHHRVHADELGHERAPQVLEVAPAHDFFHEQGLENKEPESESGDIFDDQVDPHRQPERCCNNGCHDNAGCITGGTVNCTTDALFPLGGDERLMCTRAWLLVGQHVKQEPNWPHVERHQDEAPFHHRWLGIVGELVPGDVERRKCGKSEPNNQRVVDRLNQHRGRQVREIH